MFIVSFQFCLGPLAIANDPIKEIEIYIKKIKTHQNEIAQALALFSLVKSFSARVDQNILNKKINNFIQFNVQDGKGKFIDITRRITETLLSKRPSQEQMKELTRSFSMLRKLNTNWIDFGASMTKSKEQFVKVLSENQNICSEENFYESLNFIKRVIPEGQDFGSLVKVREFGMQLTFGNDGEFESAGLNVFTEQEAKEKEKEEAVFSTALALSASIIAAGANGGPYGLTPALVVAAVLIVASAVYSAFKMKGYRKKLDELATKNNELFENMKFEYNIKSYYFKNCNMLKAGFSDHRKLVLNYLTDVTGPLPLVLRKDELEKKINKSTGKITLESINPFREPESFYLLYSNQLLEQAIVIKESNEKYSRYWDAFREKYEKRQKYIENLIYQMAYNKRNGQLREHELRFKKVIDGLFGLKDFKTTFNNVLLEFYESTSTNQCHLKNKLYSLINKYSEQLYIKTTEEIRVIRIYKNILIDLDHLLVCEGE